MPDRPGESHFMTWREKWALILITLFGAGLRLFRLDAQSVWYDESFSVAHAGRPLGELLEILIRDFVHPPLHYLVLHYWNSVLGYGAWEARMLSVVFGTLCIPVLYVLARRFSDVGTSLCAAFLLAISQVGVYFSQEARPYMQAQLLALLAAVTFLSFIENPNWKRTVLFGATGTGLLYTHYYGAASLLALGVYWLIFRRDYSPKVAWRLAGIALAMLAVFAPWLQTVAPGIRAGRPGVFARQQDPSKQAGIAAPLQALSRFNNAKFVSIEASTTIPQALAAACVFTVPAAIAAFLRRRRESRGAILGWLLASFPVGMAILGYTIGMLFNYRHYSFAVAGYCLAVAMGWRICFGESRLRWAWLAVAAVLSGAALHANYTVPTKPDYRAGFLPLSRAYAPGDCVAGRPKRWSNRVHLAWEVYYREQPLRVAPFDDLPKVPSPCERLWVVWDKTWWMNTDREEAGRALELLAEVQKNYRVERRFQHPAIDLELLVKRGD